MATDYLEEILQFAAKRAPGARDALVVGLGIYVGRSTSEIPPAFQTAWMIIATFAIVTGLTLLVTRSVRSWPN